MGKITLSMVYNELKKLNERMDFLEELAEEIIAKELPKVKLSDEEVAEIKRLIEQRRKGDYATLKECLNTGYFIRGRLSSFKA